MANLTPEAKLERAKQALELYGFVYWRDPCCYDYPLCEHILGHVKTKMSQEYQRGRDDQSKAAADQVAPSGFPPVLCSYCKHDKIHHTICAPMDVNGCTQCTCSEFR